MNERREIGLAVIGCGTIGLMALQVARAGGALTLIALDINNSRLEMAHAVGAEPALNPARQDVAAELRQLTRGRGVDVVIDAVGAAATRRAAVELVRPGGEVVWIGLHDDLTELPARSVVLGERRISGSYAVTAPDMETAIGLFAHGRIDVTAWVRPFGLYEGPQVFRRLLASPPSDYAKAILLPI